MMQHKGTIYNVMLMMYVNYICIIFQHTKPIYSYKRFKEKQHCNYSTTYIIFLFIIIQCDIFCDFAGYEN